MFWGCKLARTGFSTQAWAAIFGRQVFTCCSSTLVFDLFHSPFQSFTTFIFFSDFPFTFLIFSVVACWFALASGISAASGLMDSFLYSGWDYMDRVGGRTYLYSRLTGMMRYARNRFIANDSRLNWGRLADVLARTSRWTHWNGNGAIASSAAET